MIVVDTSALFAVLQAEQETEAFFRILRDDDVYLPASVVVEANIIALGRRLTADLQNALLVIEAQVIPLDEIIASLAVEAFRRYGKGVARGRTQYGIQTRRMCRGQS